MPWKSAEYGKLRCCAYLPIATAQYDESGHIIPFRTDSGFEAPFVPTILYDGIVNTEETAMYVIPVPKEYTPNTDTSYQSVSEKILEIARQYMKDR